MLKIRPATSAEYRSTRGARGDAEDACLRRVAFWKKAPQKLLMLWVLTKVEWRWDFAHKISTCSPIPCCNSVEPGKYSCIQIEYVFHCDRWEFSFYRMGGACSSLFIWWTTRKPFSLPKTVKIVSLLLIRLLLRTLSKIHLPLQGKAILLAHSCASNKKSLNLKRIQQRNKRYKP